MKKAFSFLGIAILGGALTLGGYKLLFNDQVVIERTIEKPLQTVKANYNPTLRNTNATEVNTDFTVAAEKTVHAVVHVKNTAVRTQTNPLELFFGNGNGQRKYEQVGTGSGVIISADEYDWHGEYGTSYPRSIELGYERLFGDGAWPSKAGLKLFRRDLEPVSGREYQSGANEHMSEIQMYYEYSF